MYYKRGLEFKLPYLCLYDFEANFNSTGNYSSNPSNEETTGLGKNILTTSRLNTNLGNGQTSNKLPQATIVSSKSASTSSALPKVKGNKSSSKISNRHQQQRFNNATSMSRSDQQAVSTTNTNYFNGLSKMDNLTSSYALYETPTSSNVTNMPLSNEYQPFSDNVHYNYTNYLTSLNSYNYSNYTTPHSSYSIYTNPHSSSQHLVSNQNGQLIFNSASNDSHQTTTTTTPSSSSIWFDEASQPTSKLGQSAYSLISYANSANQSGYKYNDLFNYATQSTTTTSAAKYPATVANSFDKTSSTSYYLDEYQNSDLQNGVNSNLYDYAKYSQNSLITKPSSISSSTIVPSNENANSNFNSGLKKEQQNFSLNQTSPPVSVKTSSTTSSSSSSTSPTILSSQTSLNTNLQDHNNNTNGLFLTSNELNMANGLYKKYENFQNDLKVHSSNSNDRNSLHSFSTSSSCSSASSSSNYCDESTVKSFIK